MSYNFYDQKMIPAESYSRQLDRRVAMDEYPYGYENEPPQAGHMNGMGLVDDHYQPEPEVAQKAPWKEMNKR